jgi:O-antigen/teichoic acid export membrane protein
MLTTSAVVGEYTAAFNLMQALIFIPTVFSTAVLPMFAKFYVDSRDMLSYSYKKSLKYLTIISMPISMGTLVLSEKIILFIYGAEYVNTIPILKLIIWALPAIFLSYILGTSIASINKQHETIKATFICLLFSTIGNYVLINLFSGIGAAMITVLNEISMVVFYMYIMHRYGYQVPLKEILIKPFIASVIMGIVIYFVNLELFTSVLLGMIVYFISIFAIKTFDDDDLNIIKELLPQKIIEKLRL